MRPVADLRALLLLYPSKGEAAGGHGPADARAMIARADPGEGWQLAADPRGVRATYLG